MRLFHEMALVARQVGSTISCSAWEPTLDSGPFGGMDQAATAIGKLVLEGFRVLPSAYQVARKAIHPDFLVQVLFRVQGGELFKMTCLGFASASSSIIP